MGRKLGNYLLSLLKRVISFYGMMIKKTARYSWHILKAAMLNAMVMIPLFLVTSFVMRLLGYDINIGIGRLIPIDNPTPAVLAGLCLIIGVIEETLYRYLIMDRLLMKGMELSTRTAVIVSSIMFGFAHLSNATATNTPVFMFMPQAVGAVGAGFVFAHLYRKHGLDTAIMAHALYDFLVMLVVFYKLYDISAW